MKNIILDKKTRNQLVILLLEGVDEAWWTTIPENFEIVNSLREFAGLDVLSEGLRELISDDLKIMN